MVLIFILGFELGPGSVGWPYVAEICSPPGITFATMANWFWTLAVGFFYPYMNDDWLPDGKAFLVFGGISFVGIIFFCMYFKETKGKTKEEIDRMFRADNPSGPYKRFSSEEVDA